MKLFGTTGPHQFYAALLGEGDVVFDVGANVGEYTHVFSRLCRKVVACEPHAKCAASLRARFRRRANVVVENVALGEKEGSALLYECDKLDLSSMSEAWIEVMGKSWYRRRQWGEPRPVAVKTLEQLSAAHGRPKFVKIDAEGYELNILEGLASTVPAVSFEFSDLLMAEARRCLDRLHEISPCYLYNYCLGHHFEFALKEHVPYRVFVNEVLPTLGGPNSVWGDIYALHR